MEQLIIAGYIPFTNVQITFGGFTAFTAALVAIYFLRKREFHIKHPHQILLPTISQDL